MIHIKTPFALDKNLGAVYNKAFECVADEDWVCLIDYDVMFLTPNSIRIMYDYVSKYPEAGMFTCLTNRIHPLAKDQLYGDVPSEIDSVRYWQNIAELAEIQTFEDITVINHEISGFLMLVSKKVWNNIKFLESGKCLGVDNDFSLNVLAAGKKIYRMNRLVVWHSYRLDDIKNKKHLL